MKKVILALALVVALVVCSVMFVACKGNETEEEQDYVYLPEKEAYTPTAVNSVLKVGAIMVGDNTEGYTKAHMDGIKAAKDAVEAANPGKTIDIIWKYKVGEDAACATAAEETIAAGAKLVITNSYGHQYPIRDTIHENPQVLFVSMTGDLAAVSQWSNWKNAFTNVYESRYVSGVVAGLKLKELVENGQVAAKNKNGDNIKIGYVGAYPYAEVVSGYTAFYLGLKSIVSNVEMTVQYTNSWFDFDKEKAAAANLISQGCIIIGQHADSEGAPTACQEALTAGTTVYSVGYNVSMLTAAPTASLTSASNNWEVYYTYLFTKMLAGEAVATDWAKGYEEDAVGITALGTSCATGTQAKVTETVDAIKAGTLKVFDCSTFKVGGQTIDSYTNAWGMNGAECIATSGDVKYFKESVIRSAPYFDIRIDGISEPAN